MKNIKITIILQFILPFILEFDLHKAVIYIITCLIVDIFLYHMEYKDFIDKSPIKDKLKESYRLRKSISKYMIMYVIRELGLYIITSIILIMYFYIITPKSLTNTIIMLMITISSIAIFKIDTIAIIIMYIWINGRCNYYLKKMNDVLINGGPYSNEVFQYPLIYSKYIHELIDLFKTKIK